MSILKNVLRYSIMVAVTCFLMWLAFQNIEVAEGESRWDFIANAWNSANKSFLMLSALGAIISHIIRAERWKLLLNPLGYNLKLSDGFLSVMIGYFINLAVPRGGELSRCYNLYRLNKTPVDVSLGTVVAERVIDLIFLVALIAVTFFAQLDQLLTFFENIDFNSDSSSTGHNYSVWIVGLIIVVLAAFVAILFLFKTKRYLMLRIIGKVRGVWLGIKKGLLSVFRLEKKELFIVYSLLIWVLYFLMSYFILMAFPETAEIGIIGALTIFVIGGIAMAAPLPGGAGSYHVLVPLGLVSLYGVAQDVATAYTFVLHGWQTMVVIILGALSLIGSQIKNN